MIDIKEADAKYLGKYFETEFWHWQSKYFSRVNIASGKPTMSFSALANVIKQPNKNTVLVSNSVETE